MLQCIVLIRCSTARDPRFDTNIGPGAFNKDKFRKQYAFLYDDVLPQEKATLKEQLKKEKSDAKKRNIQTQIARIDQQLREEQSRRKHVVLEKQWKMEEKQAVDEGKQPYFMKKSEKRKRELLAKYEDLKASGRLDKYLTKRRKKNASKDHRYLPSGRRPEQ
eukprot:jgi/Chrzof1/4468/Cz14g14110.t1